MEGLIQTCHPPHRSVSDIHHRTLGQESEVRDTGHADVTAGPSRNDTSQYHGGLAARSACPLHPAREIDVDRVNGA